MSILINKDTKVVCQGFTGKQATLHCKAMLDYGTKLIAGVSPNKGGSTHLNLPVFDSVSDAMSYQKCDVSVIFVPAIFVFDAVCEAISAKIQMIICITEGIPVYDMLKISKICKENDVTFIGPNTPGIITVDECKIGIMPNTIFKKGRAGIVSRSGTLTYEAVSILTKLGIGQSSCIGIGGDPIIGIDFADCFKMFDNDEDTDLIVMIGEIGGTLEEKGAEYFKNKGKKPVLAYIAGVNMPTETKMGHAGAIIRDLNESASYKIEFLKNSGIMVVEHLAELETKLKEYI